MKKSIVLFIALCFVSFSSAQLTVAESPGYGETMQIIGESDHDIYVMSILDLLINGGALDKNSMQTVKVVKPQKSFTYTTADKTKFYYSLQHCFVYNNAMYGIYKVTDAAGYKKEEPLPCKIYLININTLDIKDPKGVLLDEVMVMYPYFKVYWDFSLHAEKGILNYGNLKPDGVHIYSIGLDKMELQGEAVFDFGLKNSINPNAMAYAGNFLLDNQDQFCVELGYWTEEDAHWGFAYGNINQLDQAQFKTIETSEKGTMKITLPGTTYHEPLHDYRFVEPGTYTPIPNEFPRILTQFYIDIAGGQEMKTLKVALPETLLKEIYTYRTDEFAIERTDTALNGIIVHYVNQDKNGELELCFELYTRIPYLGNGNPYFGKFSSKGLFFCTVGKDGEVIKYKMIDRDVKDSYSFHYFYNNQHYFFYNKTIRKQNGKVSSSIPLFTVSVLKDNWEMEEIAYEATHLTGESKGTTLSIGPEFGYVSKDGKNVYFLGQCETAKSGSSVLVMKYEMK